MDRGDYKDISLVALGVGLSLIIAVFLPVYPISAVSLENQTVDIEYEVEQEAGIERPLYIDSATRESRIKYNIDNRDPIDGTFKISITCEDEGGRTTRLEQDLYLEEQGYGRVMIPSDSSYVRCYNGSVDAPQKEVVVERKATTRGNLIQLLMS